MDAAIETAARMERTGQDLIAHLLGKRFQVSR